MTGSRFGTLLRHVVRRRTGNDARRVPVDVRSVSEWLPAWDYADAFSVLAPEGSRPDAEAVARRLLTPSGPGRVVLQLRDVLVRPWGVAPVGNGSGPLCPLLHTGPGLAVLGMDDRHLDFRVLLRVQGRVVVCTTAVRRHSAAGRLYFAAVRPVHERLVPRLLRRAGTRDLPAR